MGFVGQRGRALLLRREFEERLKFLPQLGRTAFLKGDHEIPAMLLTHGKGPAAAIQAVEGQTQAKLRKGVFERGGQTIEGLKFTILFLVLIVRRIAARRIFDKLRGQGQGQAGGGQEFGLQERMEIGDRARGVLLSQASITMMMTEAEVTGAVDGDDEVTLKTEVVEGFHADEPLGVLVKQFGESGAADMADKMVERFCDRERTLLGAGQEVEVVEDGALEITHVVVGGTAAAQAQPEQEQSPPAKKAAVILDHGRETGVGELIQPGRQFREEMPDGFEKELGQGYDLPRLRRWAVT